MEIAIAIAVAFSIIGAFLIGGYAMIKTSEYYNRQFRDALRDERLRKPLRPGQRFE